MSDAASLLDGTLEAASTALEAGEVRAVELTNAALSRIETDRSLGGFITLDEEGARAQAAASDSRRRAGRPRGPLDGIPIALKDLLVTQGIRTTAGSRILGDWAPPYDGAMALRLAAAGAVMVGKTNLDEFGMGSSSEHSAFGPARNPWDPSRVPGGSSGGSAIAVAAGHVLGALGTDTGGSIRQPAALCGVYGLKPTYGRVSRHGLIAYASSLDQAGPFARSAHGLALLLQAIAGFDEKDSTSVDRPVPDYLRALSGEVHDLKVGVPNEYLGEGIEPAVEARVREALDVLRAAGAEVTPVALPHTRFGLSAYYIIATAEASSNLARYDGVRYGARANADTLDEMYTRTRWEGFGDEVKRRIVLGTFVLSAGYQDQYYRRAQRVRTLVRQDFERAFQIVDILAAPTSPVGAFRLGERLEDPLQMYQADTLTVCVSLAGLPAASIPCGFTDRELPVGLQLIAPWFEEERILQVAHAFERQTDFAARRPPVRPDRKQP